MKQLGATHSGHLSFERRENMIFRLPTLYKRDTKGKIRELTIEWTDTIPGTRSIAGIKDGNLVTSGWNKSEAKNEGRANATTAVQQAEKEAIADWEKKVEKEYFEDITKVDTYDKFTLGLDCQPIKFKYDNRDWKIELIEKTNSDWRDLYDNI